MSTILLVEDDPQLGPLLVALLQQSGYDRIFLACNASDARTTARAHPEIDLLLTDLGLPSQRGDALAAELSEAIPRLSVVLMSGSLAERAVGIAVRPGWGLLDKPFGREALLVAVSAALRATDNQAGADADPVARLAAPAAEPAALAQPDRNTTDESLRLERGSLDREIADRSKEAEECADDLVARARAQADVLMDAARGRVDEGARARGNRGAAGLADARAREDDIIQGQRDLADDNLRSERESQAAVLHVVLPLQRRKTDRDLLIERARSDDKIAKRDDFLGMVSHDLRSLLCGVVLEVEAVAKQSSDSAEGSRTAAAMKRLEAYVTRMSSLIEDLVDVVSIEAGKLAVRPSRGDASALLHEAVSLFECNAAAAGITLDAEIEPLLLADFDRERMLQVLANLIGNAIKFSPRDGRVVVGGALVADRLVLSVTDTGIGIPAEMLESVFKRFWQSQPTEKPGLGLGLYITRSIVEAHGGRIWAESGPGAGSAFRISLPRAAAA